MAERFRGEVLLHLEFQRRFGKVTCSSLPLVRYTTRERLDAIMAELDAKGVAVSNPHTFILDNAGWKRVDAPQAEFKRMADPHRPDESGQAEGLAVRWTRGNWRTANSERRIAWLPSASGPS